MVYGEKNRLGPETLLQELVHLHRGVLVATYYFKMFAKGPPKYFKLIFS